MRIANLSAWIMAATLSISGSLAMAEDVAGRPVDKGTGFQGAVTEVMRDIIWLDDFLLIIITAISLFVTALLGYVIVRFNKKANPKPATFTHNALIEVIWTAVPVVILVIIAIPSVRLLFLQLDVPEPDVTIKAVGNQWYWSYEYQDEGITFDSVMLTKDELADNGYGPDDHLFATDTRVVVPVNAVVHVLATATDVIHAWTIPSFGSKIDAVPGRLNETWFKAEVEGTYFGQCSELCGKDHAYMPIVVDVVSQDKYDAWVKTQQAALGIEPPTKLAAAE
ncbi:MAG TPA: cytochrome c oxidase subunit II [Thermohalobaculum sp.]|nr:cytochrome c oxidase subunit II [Thermohalobaculum sp.]